MHCCAKLGFLHNSCYLLSGQQTHAPAEVAEHLLKLSIPAFELFGELPLNFILISITVQVKTETNTRQQWEEHRCNSSIMSPSTGNMRWYKNYSWLLWCLWYQSRATVTAQRGAASPSPSLSLQLSHVATKGAFAPADDRGEAESRAGSHFSPPAKRTLGQRMESGGEQGRSQCCSKGLCTPGSEGPGDTSAASTSHHGPYSESTSPQDGSEPASTAGGKEMRRRRDDPLLAPPAPIKPPFTSCPKPSQCTVSAGAFPGSVRGTARRRTRTHLAVNIFISPVGMARPVQRRQQLHWGPPLIPTETRQFHSALSRAAPSFLVFRYLGIPCANPSPSAEAHHGTAALSCSVAAGHGGARRPFPGRHRLRASSTPRALTSGERDCWKCYQFLEKHRVKTNPTNFPEIDRFSWTQETYSAATTGKRPETKLEWETAPAPAQLTPAGSAGPQAHRDRGRVMAARGAEPARSSDRATWAQKAARKPNRRRVLAQPTFPSGGKKNI